MYYCRAALTTRLINISMTLLGNRAGYLQLLGWMEMSLGRILVRISVLFTPKWDDELCMKKEYYLIFFVTMRKLSKDNSVDKIYRMYLNGYYKLDRHDHLMVKHNLYNHDERWYCWSIYRICKKEYFTMLGNKRFWYGLNNQRKMHKNLFYEI